MAVRIAKNASSLRQSLAQPLQYPEKSSTGAVRNKNLVINGDFMHWQRGTSATVDDTSENSYLSADRWTSIFDNADSDATGTVSRSTDVPLPEFQYSLLHTTTATGNVNLAAFRYVFEGYDHNKMRGKWVTTSFWFKASEAGEYCFQHHAINNGGIMRPFWYPFANDWVKYAFTYYIPDSANYNNTNGVGSRMYVVFGVSGNYDVAPGTSYDTWERGSHLYYGTFSNVDIHNISGAEVRIAGVQTEIGKEATPFAHEHYTESLAKCKRYFQKSTEDGVYPANGPNTTSFASSMGNTLNLPPVAIWSHPTHVYLPVEMRAAPTMTRYGNSQGYWGYLSVGTAGPSGLSSINFHQNVYIGGTPKTVYVNNQVSTNPMWGAKGMWEADAEL